MEGAPQVARCPEHRPRWIRGMEEGGVIEETRAEGLLEYDANQGNRVGVAVDGHRHDQGPSRGKSTGPNPTKRANGTDAEEHRHRAGEANERRPQNMRMDEGYDFPEVDGLVADYKLFIVSKGLRRNGTKPPASAFLDDLGSCLGVTTRTLHGCRVLDVVQADRNEGPDGLAKADPSRLSLALVRCISQQSGVKLVVHRDGESFHPYGLWSGRRY